MIKSGATSNKYTLTCKPHHFVVLLNGLFGFIVLSNNPSVNRFLFYVREEKLMSYERLYLDWTLTLSDE